MLRIENLEVFGLQPVSLDVRRGKCLAVQGPSGSGKTLLLRAIADLDPAAGRVFLQDRERSSMSGPQWRRHVRYSAAEPGWWRDTVRSHFAETDALEKQAKALGLASGKLDQPITELSTGERQRFALLRAVADGPDVLLLDEPTGALDPKATRQVETLVKRLLRSGVTVLLVSHDPAQVNRLAGRTCTIRGGRLTGGRS